MAKIVKLKNGIPVYFEKNDYVKSISIGIYVKTGAKYENNKESGISHLLEHMLFKGTQKRDAKKISEEVDEIGGHINAFTGKEATGYYITVLSEKLKEASEILADIFINSIISEEELIKEKKVVIEEIKMYEDIPEEKVHDVSCELALKGSGLGNSISGSEESVNGITREMLIKYKNEKYTIENSCIAVAGNYDEEFVVELLNELFSNLQKSSKIVNNSVLYKFNTGIEIIRKDINQIHLCINSKGVNKADKNKYAVSIISSVLGGNMSSRLFQQIREDRGLAYSVYSYHSSYFEGGLFTSYAGTTNENYKEVIEIIKNEYENIKKYGISKEELEKSKNQILSSMIFGLETTKGMMSRLGSMFINYGRIVTIEEVAQNIRNVTLENILSAADEIFIEDNFMDVVLGDIE